MFTVALTGGVASGKSTVERLFASRGIEIIDADPRRVKRVRIFRRPPDPPIRERKRKPKAQDDAAARSAEAGSSADMDKRNDNG